MRSIRWRRIERRRGVGSVFFSFILKSGIIFLIFVFLVFFFSVVFFGVFFVVRIGMKCMCDKVVDIFFFLRVSEERYVSVVLLGD